MRVDVAGERQLGTKSLGAAVHHTDEGLLADMGGDVVTQPGVRGGGGRVHLAPGPQAVILPAFISLLAAHVNSLQERRKLNKQIAIIF